VYQQHLPTPTKSATLAGKQEAGSMVLAGGCVPTTRHDIEAGSHLQHVRGVALQLLQAQRALHLRLVQLHLREHSTIATQSQQQLVRRANWLTAWQPQLSSSTVDHTSCDTSFQLSPSWEGNSDDSYKAGSI
jgi:hypothetical protein